VSLQIITAMMVNEAWLLNLFRKKLVPATVIPRMSQETVAEELINQTLFVEDVSVPANMKRRHRKMLVPPEGRQPQTLERGASRSSTDVRKTATSDHAT
jgi:hypothetical protein